jgi:hypothetical protein
MQAARLRMEALLRERRLDRTVTDVLAVPEPQRTASTGVPWLDVHLGGGWPWGETSEVAGPASSGRTALLMASMAAATARGELAALVDATDTFDTASAAGAGVALDQLLWARGDPAATTAQAIDRAVKAFGLVLEAGGFGLVALDVGDLPAAGLARLPFTTWRRLQRFVEGRDTVALVLAPAPMARSARGVTVALGSSPATAVWEGRSRRARRLTGLALSPAVQAARRLGASPLESAVEQGR